MKKVDALSKAEKQRLHEFVGHAVMENVLFPATDFGGQKKSIQELLHNRTVESLEKYADFLENNGGKLSRTEKRLHGGEDKKIEGSDITYVEAVEILDLIVKEKHHEEYRAKVSKKRIELQKQIDDLKTPAEKKKELMAEMKALTGATA